MSATPALAARDLRKTFRRDNGELVIALDGVSFSAEPGALNAIVGPDGAGKTTFMRLAAGLLRADAGTLAVCGLDVASDPQAVQDRIGYMPQKFGLYEDLSVQENLDLYADLHGVSKEERAKIYPRLMEMTELAPFRARLAGNLSGGMKQKLGLACTLVRAPTLLLLDEPTVGVDPLSRRELWSIVETLVREQGLSVLLATSYLDEAERCRHCMLLHEGRALAQGRPDEITAKARGMSNRVTPAAGLAARLLLGRLFRLPGLVDAVPQAGPVRVVLGPDSDPALLQRDDIALVEPAPPRFEDAFMLALQKASPRSAASELHIARERAPARDDIAVRVDDLVRTFGPFVAVDHVSFSVKRGEIFGLLGPNGAGKSTTFRMLCGLLPASGGRLEVAGSDLRHARAPARARLGYVAQKFSLYGQLSVRENLAFFASAYGLFGRRRTERVAWALHQFALEPFADLPSAQLPGGFKQRLSMAAALLHEPDILFLDEATSGADPLARREFWARITDLAAQGVTIIVTTHFLEEAEYCDRVVIMDAGRSLAEGTPAEIRAHAPRADGEAPSMEDAFIAIVEKSRHEARERRGA